MSVTGIYTCIIPALISIVLWSSLLFDMKKSNESISISFTMLIFIMSLIPSLNVFIMLGLVISICERNY